MAVLKVIFISLCYFTCIQDGAGQDMRLNSLSMRFGYALTDSEKLGIDASNPFTPHVWIAYTRGTDFTYGAAFFHNLDRIKREWPSEGVYLQTKRELGFGAGLGYTWIWTKNEAFCEFILGMKYARWVVSSKNEFLQHAILPREEPQFRILYHLRAGYRYNFINNWFAGIAVGAGENNIDLQISKRF